jgi:hypothetical protein
VAGCVLLFMPVIEETGAMGCEIESCQGMG